MDEQELRVERERIEMQMEAWANAVGMRVWHQASGGQLLWLANNIANTIIIRGEQERWKEFLALVEARSGDWSTARFRWGMDPKGAYGTYIAEFSRPEAIEAVTEMLATIKGNMCDPFKGVTPVEASTDGE